MAQEVSAAGAVVWRPDARDRTGETVEIALVHRPRYDDWSLPKGKLERGETSRIAAAREVAEETGFRVRLGRHLGRVRYRVTRPEPADKVVEYYAARAGGGAFAPGDETDELRWLPPEKAFDLLSYDHDERIVAAFTALPPDLTTVLLVRHAKAGSRAEWREADDLRPLSANGRRQVPPINAMAALYGADRVYSAPLVRCVDTVRQVADELGATVVTDPLLSEASYADTAEPTVARFLEIVTAGGTPVVCSQGGVIPDLVSRVAGAAGLAPGEVVSKKASIWALFFTVDGDAHLVAADYIPKP
ncbi:MAG: NUDIX domain-containing protein [Actinophytocola sp.]|uniref:NUDIX hydrolase n=1 Tax=Actinophytocola sp. TaxID=1872138 RepID=UPI001324414B|nr:NUDIX hydrolase [Actinophytocola sp.]MPZ84516.1 NUDIX domain-containing protein [Actinophytocola sp.]